MSEQPPNRASLFRTGSVVVVGIDLPGRSFAEDQAVVRAAGSGVLLLELCGGGFPSHLRIDRGSRVIISGGEERIHFNVKGVLKSPLAGSLLEIELVDEVKVLDRRAYFRADVLVPVHYALPATQDMWQVIAEWQAFAEYGARSDDAVAACSKSRVNLSGSGIRIKIRDCLAYGTLLHVKVALPGNEDSHIHAVGAIIRTKELLPEMNRLEYYSTSMSFRMIKSADRLNLIKHIIDARHNVISN
jgi:hypothetical protein